MEKIKFIFEIEAGPDFHILTRILNTISRNRINIHELHVQAHAQHQWFKITLADTKENAVRLSKKLQREIDVHTINLFQQQHVYEAAPSH